MLWDAVAPGLVDGEGDVLVGMGTLLGRWFMNQLPDTGRRVVLGAGGGKDAAPFEVESLKVYGVRGPLTCAYLGLDFKLALTDPAMVLRDTWAERPPQRTGIGFMPHYLSLGSWDWPAFCAKLDLIYVDPHAPPEDTVRRIAGLERLLTEAMHGAIVADALRTPWVALRISKDNYTGKWDDWGATLRLPVYFKQIPSLYDAPTTDGLRERVEAWTTRTSERLIGRRRLAQRPRSSDWEIDECAKLLGFERVSEPQLSRDLDLSLALERFYSALDQLKSDQASGRIR